MRPYYHLLHYNHFSLSLSLSPLLPGPLVFVVVVAVVAVVVVVAAGMKRWKPRGLISHPYLILIPFFFVWVSSLFLLLLLLLALLRGKRKV